MTGSLLGKLELFRDVPGAERDRLAEITRWYLYQKHDVLPSDDEQPTVLLISNGIVGISAVSPWCDRFISLTLSAGDIVALHDVPDSLCEVTYAEVLTDSALVYRLPERHLEEMKCRYPGVWRAVERRTNQYLHAVTETLLDFVFYDAETRLARILGRLVLQTGEDKIWLTHEELGMLAGLKRQKVTEYLGNFTRRGLVQHVPHKRGVTVPDPALLASMVSAAQGRGAGH